MAEGHVPLAVINMLGQFQCKLNETIDADWVYIRSLSDWSTAIHVEIVELIDSYPWKWWKNKKISSNDTTLITDESLIDYENVKIELIDILHFALAGSIQIVKLSSTEALHKYKSINNKDLFDDQLILPDSFKSAGIAEPIKNVYQALTTYKGMMLDSQRFDFSAIIRKIVRISELLDFNAVGYYVAKHTLNLIRLLRGYKEGTYVKKNNRGEEDNVLLHRVVQPYSTHQCIFGNDITKYWEEIRQGVYDQFDISAEERISIDEILN